MPKTFSCGLLSFFAAVAGAAPATAARLELQAGRSYMDAHPANTAFVEVLFAPHPIGDSRFSWAPDLSAGWIDGRNVARYRADPYDTSDAIRLGAIGARFRHGTASTGWFFSEQLAGIHGRTQALSSGYQFVSTLGWQGRRFSLQLRHVSNGGLHTPNRGETMALIGIGFGR